MQLPEIKIGDLIELGDHRLVCGDSSNTSHLRTLMPGNEKINMVLTDAPYGVAYVEGKKDFLPGEGIKKHKAILNDGLIQDYELFTRNWMEPMIQYLASHNQIYMFNGDTKMRELLNAMHALKFTFSQLIIWNKTQGVVGRKDYQPMHELIFYGWYGRHKYYGGKDKSVLDCPKPSRNSIHPTMKPPRLLRKLLHHGSEPGMVVYDAFGGSGSTLIACEHLGRKCRMIELDPAYCSAIITRYIKLRQETGKPISVKVNGVEIPTQPDTK